MSRGFISEDAPALELELRDRFIAAASNQLNAEIGPDTDLTELGDDLDLAAIEMTVEENSGITIPDEFLAEHKTPRLAAEALREMA